MRRVQAIRTASGTLLLAAGVALAAVPSARADDFKAGAITVTAPWMRATPGGVTTAAAYFEVRAPAGTADTLIGVASPAAAQAELHTHIHDNGIMRMRRVQTIPVPGGTPVVLKPDAMHVMLVGLKRPLKPGDAIEMTVTFEKAGPLTLTVPVAAIGAGGPPAAGASGGGHEHHQHK